MAQNISEIKFEIKGIGDFISDKFLTVPIFQRPYSWGNEHVEYLFQDILSVKKGGEYFIGSIVITKGENDKDYEVVDGQQRLATICILLSAIRNFYSLNGFDEDVKDIEGTFLSKYDRSSGTNRAKLVLTSIDNDLFYNEIVLPPSQTSSQISTRDSHKRMKATYELSKIFISKIIALYNEKEAQRAELISLTDFIQNKLKVIIVTAPDDADAFAIFETLNDRGKKLGQIDLIKNYLFQKSKTRIAEAQDYWSRMTGTIEMTSNEEEVEIFIRYHWCSLYGFIRNDQLFKVLRSRVTNPTLSISHLQNLFNDSEKYVALLNPNHPFWTMHGDTTKEYVKILNTLRLTQYRPLALAILNKFTVTEVKKSFKLLVSWSVRNLITGNIGGGTMEQMYSEKAVAVNSGTIKNTLELKKALKDFIPNDAEFKNKFLTASVSQAYLARYYFRTLERQFNGDTDPELIPNENTDALNLEHILPKNPTNLKKDWSAFTEEMHNAYFKRIGNLTLMKSKLNSDIGNGPFKDKKDFYKESDLKITSQLNNYADWTVKEIEERQNMLAELAIKAWNLNV